MPLKRSLKDKIFQMSGKSVLEKEFEGQNLLGEQGKCP
jgi:hypothetical protein